MKLDTRGRGQGDSRRRGNDRPGSRQRRVAGPEAGQLPTTNTPARTANVETRGHGRPARARTRPRWPCHLKRPQSHVAGSVLVRCSGALGAPGWTFYMGDGHFCSMLMIHPLGRKMPQAAWSVARHRLDSSCQFPFPGSLVGARCQGGVKPHALQGAAHPASLTRFSVGSSSERPGRTPFGPTPPACPGRGLCRPQGRRYVPVASLNAASRISQMRSSQSRCSGFIRTERKQSTVS